MSPEIVELHRKNMATVLRAMAQVSQAKVAELIGVSPTLISRMKDEELERMVAVLAACGLVARPITDKSVSPERLRALEVLARESLSQPESGWGSL